MENKGKNKGHDNLIPIKPGETRNPNGRPKGRRNFSTIFYDALEKLAAKNGMDADTLETEILEKALISARKGDHRFYKDLMDRLHGTATHHIDHTSNGKELPAPIISLSEIRRDNSTT